MATEFHPGRSRVPEAIAHRTKCGQYVYYGFLSISPWPAVSGYNREA
ncbi:hypothetical protein sce0727 [Sorangium cellulosum So ce56]|uniref:Transposase n=1 Tax=Sorangium cellulosum (strain So ce56) TaxID=448385 RepID=A9ENP5_SORC5|nr:hypothetical protein sce0727 [Sorangium cellulosum So ce56]